MGSIQQRHHGRAEQVLMVIGKGRNLPGQWSCGNQEHYQSKSLLVHIPSFIP
jgi:hypothetical protein